MLANAPDILALDFDGVICDGLKEYFQTTWKTYCQIWKPDNTEIPQALAPTFYQLRPVIETGWEMPILLRAIILGISFDEILQDWPRIRDKIIKTENLNGPKIGQTLDSIRDNWIERDLESWLSLHEFYPGVVNRIKAFLNSRTQVFIITTKEGRFANQLLQQSGIHLSPNVVFGKECKRPKTETLQQLLEKYPEQTIWFIEDRLETLKKVEQQPHLDSVQLYLADWGYNTQAMRNEAQTHSRIQVLSLDKFTKMLGE
ncbi:MAG: HAD family hydrolase [Chroococcales cyanobacterium]